MHYIYNKKLILSSIFLLFSLSACQSGESPGPAGSDQNRPELDAVDKTSASVAQPQSQRMRFPVSGMVCEGCENSIRGAVEKLEGVVACTASHTAQEAVIDYDPTKISPERLSETIAKLGYEVGQGAKVTEASKKTPNPAPASASSPN